MVSAAGTFVALPPRRWPGRFPLLVALLLSIGLVGAANLDGLGWPELLIAVAPLVGGLLLRAWWWLLLYPAGVAASLYAAGEFDRYTFPAERLWRHANAPLDDLLRDLSDSPLERLYHSISATLPTEAYTVVVAATVLFAVIGTVAGKILAKLIGRA
jgi:hypothetical protein